MIKLPGVGGYAENIVVKVEKIRAWRADMQLPPRGADLWRASAELQLYGSEAELEEVSKTNTLRPDAPTALTLHGAENDLLLLHLIC